MMENDYHLILLSFNVEFYMSISWLGLEKNNSNVGNFSPEKTLIPKTADKV